MRIQYLSGNHAGQFGDVPDAEGENLVATGFAKRVDASPAGQAPAAESSRPKTSAPKASKSAKPGRSGKRK